jgi:uncharacterized protein YbaR (Trm112 family)
MEILVCPVCKGPLELVAEVEKGDEVMTGKLICQRCKVTYPIDESIPNLLPPAQRQQVS